MVLYRLGCRCRKYIWARLLCRSEKHNWDFPLDDPGDGLQFSSRRWSSPRWSAWCAGCLEGRRGGTLGHGDLQEAPERWGGRLGVVTCLLFPSSFQRVAFYSWFCFIHLIFLRLSFFQQSWQQSLQRSDFSHNACWLEAFFRSFDPSSSSIILPALF